MNKIRSRKGFTLAEMIISIGVLALFSGLILQLFVTAQNLNLSSRDLDYASSAAVNMAEAFKSSGNTKAFIYDGQFESVDVNDTDGKTTIKINYDSDWKMINTADDSDKKTVFVLTAVVSESAGPEALGVLNISVRTTVDYKIENKRDIELMSLETKKLFFAGKGSE